MEQRSEGDGEKWKTNEDLVDPAVETSPECRKAAGARRRAVAQGGVGSCLCGERSGQQRCGREESSAK